MAPKIRTTYTVKRPRPVLTLVTDGKEGLTPLTGQLCPPAAPKRIKREVGDRILAIPHFHDGFRDSSLSELVSTTDHKVLEQRVREVKREVDHRIRSYPATAGISGTRRAAQSKLMMAPVAIMAANPQAVPAILQVLKCLAAEAANYQLTEIALALDATTVPQALVGASAIASLTDELYTRIAALPMSSS